MISRDEPKTPARDLEPEFEATDGGWDPYITALLNGAATQADESSADEDDGTPVMSFSRRPASR